METDVGATAEKAEFKTFVDLIEEVHKKGICGQCGGCVSFCSASEYAAIKMGELGVPKFDNQEKCVKCGLCYLICPQIDSLNEDLDKRFNWKFPIGNYSRIYSAKTTDPELHEAATDGGVVSAVLLYLLEKNYIDGVIASKRIAPFKRISTILKTKQDILEAAGTKVCDITEMDEELGSYSTYTPISFELKKFMDVDLLKLAVVGTPCQIHTIRKMQILGVIPSHIIKFTIGLFCNENFTFDEKTRKKLEAEKQFKFEDIKKMNFKEDLIINLNDGRKITMSFEELDLIMRPACRACSDFSNEYADISVGGLASPDGYTTTVLRTKLGEDYFFGALKEKYIEINETANNPVQNSVMLTKIINYSKWKKNRAKKFFEKISKKS